MDSVSAHFQHTKKRGYPPPFTYLFNRYIPLTQRRAFLTFQKVRIIKRVFKTHASTPRVPTVYSCIGDLSPLKGVLDDPRRRIFGGLRETKTLYLVT